MTGSAPGNMGSHLPRSEPGGSALPACAGVFAIALLVRLVYLWQASSSPVFNSPIVDAMEYDALARSAAAGKGISQGFFWQPFFYPAFLSGLYVLGGSSMLLARIIQVCLGALTCALTCLLGRRLFGGRTGLLAGIIAALYGPLVFFDGELLGTGLECLWAVVLLLLVTGEPRGRGLRWWFLFGLCAALSTLTRPTFAPFLAAAFLWLVVTQYRAGTRLPGLLSRVALMTAALALVTMPVARLNQRVNGRFSIMPYSGGLNLYIGNNENSDATVAARPGWAWDTLTLMPKQYGVNPGYDTSRFFTGKVAEYARRRPAAFLRGMARKAVQFVSSRELPRNDDIYVLRKWSPLLRTLVWKARGFGFPFGILLPLALIGFAAHWRKVPLPVTLFVVLYSASVVLVFVCARYRMPVIPAAAVLAAAGCAAVLDALRGSRGWGAAGTIAASVAVAAACSVPGPFAQEKTDYEAEMYYCLSRNLGGRGELDKAEAMLARALELEPGYGDACNSLGVIREKRGDLEGAARYYSMAAEANPRHVTAIADLAETLYKLGRLDECAGKCAAALALDPKRADMHLRLGLVRGQQGRTDEALASFTEAVRLAPGDVVARTNLGVALAGNGQSAAAIEQFRAALEYDPGFGPALDHLLAEHIAGGARAQAASDCRSILRRLEATGNAEAAARVRARLASIEPGSK